MKSATSTDTMSPDKERMDMYRSFSTAFSYPDEKLSESFSLSFEERRELAIEYDRLFRANNVWLYGAEYVAANEFQRVQHLSDIMGFYHAFGLEPDKDRPDSLHIELEFMHYLIFKEIHALLREDADSIENASVCRDAQKKFFNEHMHTAAKNIAEAVISHTNNHFYSKTAKDLLGFLETEAKFFGRNA
ncbi:TorD/DmsD family molecular chaperone [Candidatus Methanoperedens nitratireducens]|uniref:Uncharacterized protein n=1 Tax=Candidatus Methanoperedens nitratireducens TaxID=1392998 RepID=A0A284VS67_9EURY|nr:molecular chaperone TorD family protein [Candidatus Methanoperedens nitroreducens]SNQ62033.1 conserved hypothetical protein [Candidatus Methanoperedens nitroreducens]